MAPKIDITTYPGNIINGKFAPSPTTRHSINPANAEPLYEVPVAASADLDDAVKHARAAFPAWSTAPFSERAKLVSAYADALEENRAEIEILQTTEQGKPLSLSTVEVGMTLDWLRAFATMELRDQVIEDTDEKTIYTTYLPLGVVGAIVPWNWPILLGAGKIGPALMTGNAIIVKPSPYTPYCNLKMAELGMSIFPPGVFQVAASCSTTLKRYVLELGGNDAAVVCEDVDIDKCVPKISTLSFLNTGQICMLAKRIYVHEYIYSKFKGAMVEFTKANIRTGSGFEDGIVVGPAQNSTQFDLFKNMYSEIDKCGWKTALEGRVRSGERGYYIEPSIIDNPPEDSRMVVEEPVWINSHFDVAPNVPFGGNKESGIGREWGIEGFKHFTNITSLWVWKKVFD
ncbi:aldehyde dehydrogenase-like protein [Thozetella sp. PMI_491]|nr:aldehyde dehydrogenase-like protein [Thozetella sp. PMI_491]